MAKRLLRSEVPIEQTWNLTDIFPTKDAWEAEMAAIPELISNVTQFKGKLGEGPKVLLACLDAQEAMLKRVAKTSAYASFHMSCDGTNPVHQSMAAQASSMGATIQADTSFIQSEALGLPDGTLDRYLATESGLEPYKITIEKWIEKKPHLLSPETEMVLAALSEALNSPANIYETSRTADLTFESIPDSKGEMFPMSLGRHESASDLVLRRNAYASLTNAMKPYQNTYGTAWGAEVKKNVVEAKLRGFDSAIHMLLDRQEVTIDIYNNIHDVILTELAPHMRRYLKLRKEILGLEKVLYCDLEAPLDPEFNPTTTYEEASEIVLAGLSILGPEYTEIIDQGLHNRWIDRADNLGKRTGAFCHAVYGVHPYVSMTWGNHMRNALTMAHELGHGGQGVMAQRYQRLANTRPTMFFIEAPSTINEILVGNYILAKTTDIRMRRWLLIQFIMSYHHNFIRHLVEGELQRRTYAMAEKGTPITATVLNKVQAEILHDFWGDDLELDEGASLVWMRQSHYYRGLYPYSYAAGLTIGTNVAKNIQDEGAPAAERWVNVLKAGGTKGPLGLAKMAGVDMTNKDAIRTAVAYVGSLVDEVIKSFE